MPRRVLRRGSRGRHAASRPAVSLQARQRLQSASSGRKRKRGRNGTAGLLQSGGGAARLKHLLHQGKLLLLHG